MNYRLNTNEQDWNNRSVSFPDSLVLPAKEIYFFFDSTKRNKKFMVIGDGVKSLLDLEKNYFVDQLDIEGAELVTAADTVNLDELKDGIYHFFKIDSGVTDIIGATKNTINGHAVAEWQLKGQFTEIKLQVLGNDVYAVGNTIIGNYTDGTKSIIINSNRFAEQIEQDSLITDSSLTNEFGTTSGTTYTKISADRTYLKTPVSIVDFCSCSSNFGTAQNSKVVDIDILNYKIQVGSKNNATTVNYSAAIKFKWY